MNRNDPKVLPSTSVRIVAKPGTEIVELDAKKPTDGSLIDVSDGLDLL